MALADRDYQRNQPAGGGFFSQLTPVVKWLLIANAAIYLLDLVLAPEDWMVKPMRQAGAFSVGTAIYGHHYWQFVTFQFLHGSVEHVLFNSIGMFFFGPWMERWWGTWKFLAFYLICGVGGAAFFTLLLASGMLPGDSPHSSLVGASAGIYGILIGVAVTSPNLRVHLLFPPIELSMRQLAMALMGMAVVMILFKIGGNEGGEAGHLGGAIVGFLLARYPQLLGGGHGYEIVRPVPTKPRPLPKLRPRSVIEKEQDSAVDLILDKISRDGFQSLTQAERDLLNKVSNQKKSSQ